MKTTYLIVPGYTNSGADHWQSYMEKKYTNVTRVQQNDWNNPSRSEWIEKLNEIINKTDGEIILLGHSCGAVTVAQWASSNTCNRIKAIILVAPADVDAKSAISPIRQQRPLPSTPLGIRSLLIYSDNDEYLSETRACELAALWGSKTHCVQGAGHIHSASGYGEWIEGEKIFEKFTSYPLLHARKRI